MHELNLKKVDYRKLKARQKENYNYCRLSGLLAEYGYVTLRLTDDWGGADFIAQHIDGTPALKVQLKGRVTFRKEYCHKDLYIAFRRGDSWFLYPHDRLLEQVLAVSNVGQTKSWRQLEGYSFAGPSRKVMEMLAPYEIKL